MKKVLFIAFIICLGGGIKANNIVITNISVVPANNTIKFDISWENGWRSTTLNNWDAAWVFFKYKDVSGNWIHLNLTNSGNVIPAGFVEKIPPTNVGAFLYRSAAGSGATALTNVELGVAAAQASGIYDIKVFAIEMVYIPQAAFFVGDGVSSGAYSPIANITSTNTSIYDPLASPPATITSSTFPNGYSAFYCMKYELSQGGYRDFLNTLTYDQQVSHIVPPPSASGGSAALVNTHRNKIRIKTSGIASTTPAVFGCDANENAVYDEAGDGEWVACNFLNWVDHAAYLFWAGLRPLTELEFEKAARGILLPVSDEYAWGNNNINGTPYTFTNLDMASESVSNASANPFGNVVSGLTFSGGPVRNGIFATASSNRISSGGSFYGVMELSGNLVERVVTTATIEGRVYTGTHGSGTLSINGFAGNGVSNIFWPLVNTGTFYIDGTIFNSSLIVRAGSFLTTFLAVLNTSYRLLNAGVPRASFIGVRGCCTAP